ncbi:hypothetical protein OKJ48_15045 [Streptomyces kunmingensis]|uniref:Uncharacterized protein n=1 Tax=Streptomyces kunmingensis TaxID=68225 RepID=A0ABU6CA18_9ACTN|nr:hypothetical protein [Streptomyces kunmingensis]MEB3961554.1 hypothetical protein [Streptomyces kunmingensis]
MSHSPEVPARYTVVLKPRLTDADGHPDHGNPLRSVPVTATGAAGASGYPRYAGEGVQADIDPRTRAVEAVTVDGEELPYGWVAEVEEE